MRLQKQKHSIRPMMEAEKQTRFDGLVQIGCIACRLSMGVYSVPIVHHLCGLDSSRQGLGGKADDRETIGLCPAHHKYGGVGISYHDAPKTWESKYGTQRELLEITNELLDKHSECGIVTP